jgi:hypothetical protein
MRDIRDPDEACASLFEMLISLKFNKKIQLIFDEDIAGDQPGSPLLKMNDAIKAFKGNKRYGKMLGDLEMMTVNAGEIEAKVTEADKEGREVFVFSTADKRKAFLGMESLKKTHISYVHEDGFPLGAYYPLLEMLVISLARSIDPEIVPQGVTKVLKSLDLELNLEEVNIGSVEREGKTLIFTLIPDAVAFEKDELIKMYALLGRFLASA